jgi:hypothetical protein
MNPWEVAAQALTALTPAARALLSGDEHKALIATEKAIAKQVNKASTEAAKKAKGKAP